MDRVVALGAPGDVVCVAKRVYLKSADVRREEREVLAGRREHVPRIQIDEGHEEVKANSGTRRNDEVGEDIVADADGCLVCKLSDDNVERGKCRVGHDDAEDDHAAQEHFLGALRPVAHGEDELHANEEDAGISQDNEDDIANAVAERVKLWIGERAGDKVESEVEVCLGYNQ